MEKDDQSAPDETRREFLKTAGAGVLVAALGGRLLSNPASAATPSADPEPRKAADGPYNILFILTDQERYFRPGELPRDYGLPAHERLAKNGVVFENHRINSCVCTCSRSVIYTGRHNQQTKMFDNANIPWMQSIRARKDPARLQWAAQSEKLRSGRLADEGRTVRFNCPAHRNDSTGEPDPGRAGG